MENAPKVYSLKELRAMTLGKLEELKQKDEGGPGVNQIIIEKKNNGIEGNAFYNGPSAYDESYSGGSGVVSAERP